MAISFGQGTVHGKALASGTTSGKPAYTGETRQIPADDWPEHWHEEYHRVLASLPSLTVEQLHELEHSIMQGELQAYYPIMFDIQHEIDSRT